MDFMQFVDMFLHVDKYLGTIIEQYGSMIYGVLFAIIFSETGLVVLPFLPGDSLLFVAGASSANGAMNIWLLIGLLVCAAVAGNSVNYWIGSAIGHKVFTHDYRWIDKDALRRTHVFYEKHGGKMLVLARFLPVVRTFAPFVAGVSEMTFLKFQFFNFFGGVIWVAGLLAAGYQFGNIAFIRNHLNIIVLIGVSAAVVPLALGGIWKLWRKVSGEKLSAGPAEE